MEFFNNFGAWSAELCLQVKTSLMDDNGDVCLPVISQKMPKEADDEMYICKLFESLQL